LRVLRSAGFEGEVHLVETSPVLCAMQKSAVPDAQLHDSIDALPERPLLLAANEFLDALPVRQEIDGIERRVTLAGGGLAFDRDGEIIETSPARDEAIAAVARRLVAQGGVALLIDYGHSRSASGETLQAVRRHRFSAVFDKPGEQDLTAHLDFEAVRRSAESAGTCVSPLARQGEWLRRLGIENRAAMLAEANRGRATEFRSALRRLTAEDEMGTLFKAIAIHAPDWPQPAGFE
jgi:NADH dehydrogenase [ubiquinone] 1 alpha subcomplex assembly factor 7